MARTVRNPKIDTRTARTRLLARREPYWTALSEGCALGYRRGAKGGTWIGRFRDEDGRQHYEAKPFSRLNSSLFILFPSRRFLWRRLICPQGTIPTVQHLTPPPSASSGARPPPPDR